MTAWIRSCAGQPAGARRQCGTDTLSSSPVPASRSYSRGQASTVARLSVSPALEYICRPEFADPCNLTRRVSDYTFSPSSSKKYTRARDSLHSRPRRRCRPGRPGRPVGRGGRRRWCRRPRGSPAVRGSRVRVRVRGRVRVRVGVRGRGRVRVRVRASL